MRPLVPLLGLLLAVPAAADEVPPAIEGIYQRAETREEARQAIDGAIEEALRAAPFFVRPFAWRPLREATLPCMELEIREVAEGLQIRCDDRPPSVAPPDGTPVEYVDEHGQSFQVSQEVVGDRIIQEWESDRGTRQNVYYFENGGAELRLRTTVRSPRLPEPVRYEEPFVAQEE